MAHDPEHRHADVAPEFALSRAIVRDTGGGYARKIYLALASQNSGCSWGEKWSPQVAAASDTGTYPNVMHVRRSPPSQDGE